MRLKYLKKSLLKKIIVNKEYFVKTYIDTDDFISSRINDNSQAYSRFAIAEKLGFKTKKFLKTKSENLKPIIKNNFILLGLRKLVQLYIKTFNPIVLIDCYFGKINSFKIFINSFGKILSVNSSIFFNEKPPKLKKDEAKRKKLLVVEKDHFDEIFNKLFKKFLPSSYLENYSHYEKFNKSFKNIKKIGSAVNIIYNDQFKLLSANILEQKGKLYVFPHGGLLGQNKDDYDQIVEKKYATKVFRHYDKAPIEQNQYLKLISYNLNNIKKNNQILFYPTSMFIKSNYKIPLLKKYHPYCNFFYELYDNLSLQLKDKVRLKTFPHFISKYFERNWIKIYKKNFFEKQNKYLFNKSKIVIIDDYSTPLCELLYTDTPFMILDPEKNLKPEILKKILKLKKLNILFENPKKASNFLNNNYDKLDKWWSKILKNKNYLDLKKNLISENKKKINLEKALN